MAHREGHRWLYASGKPARHADFICPLCRGEGTVAEQPENEAELEALGQYKKKIHRELDEIDQRMREL